MATGFSRTLEAGHEEAFDFICARCDMSGKSVEALHFCTDCNELYCKTCLEFHSSFPGLKDHKVVGRDKKKSWRQKKKSTSVPTEPCSQHDGELLQMYCGKHNMLCCHVCVSLQHRTCTDLDFIPHLARGIAQSQELQDINKKLDSVKSDIERTKNTREKNKANLDQSRSDVLQSLKDFRTQVNQIFDALERKATDVMEKLHRDSSKPIMADMTMCDNFLAELKQLKQQLESTSHNNESQVFINLKKCQNEVSDGEQLVQKMSSSPINESFQFLIDPTLEKFLANTHSLGKLEVKIKRPEVKVQGVQKQLYKAQNIRNCNVRMKGDIGTCNIGGSCQMPDGSIVLTDYDNKKLKHLDTSYRVIDHCDIPSSPRAVCCISQSEAAVVKDNSTLNFVSVSSNKMAVNRSVKMNHDCWGLAYNNGRLYIADKKNKVYIYNTYGTSLQTLYKDSNGVEMFSNTRHIAVSPDGTRIYVADVHNGLVTLDNKGQQLSKFTDKDLDGAVGVCVDGRGSVFVTGLFSHNVIQLDETGTQKIGVVATLGSNVYIQSVLIDKTNSTMILTCTCTNNGSDTIRVFEIK